MWTNGAAVNWDLSYWDTPYCSISCLFTAKTNIFGRKIPKCDKFGDLKQLSGGREAIYHPQGWLGDVFPLTK
jgi:hypothetical protein